MEAGGKEIHREKVNESTLRKMEDMLKVAE